jgi:hypothetical protein
MATIHAGQKDERTPAIFEERQTRFLNKLKDVWRLDH